MSKEFLIERIKRYLQAEYVKTGVNEPVEWRPLAPILGVAEGELSNALDVAFDAAGGQLDLEMAGRDHIRLGVRSLNETDIERNDAADNRDQAGDDLHWTCRNKQR